MQTLLDGARVGNVSPVVMERYTETIDGSRVWRVMVGGQEEDPDRVWWRKEKLESVQEEPDLSQQEKMKMLEFLTGHHLAFSLEEGEQGETSLVQMEISTGNAQPSKQ